VKVSIITNLKLIIFYSQLQDQVLMNSLIHKMWSIELQLIIHTKRNKENLKYYSIFENHLVHLLWLSLLYESGTCVKHVLCYKCEVCLDSQW